MNATLTTPHAVRPVTASALPERPAPISATVAADVDRVMLDASTAFPALEHALHDPSATVRPAELTAIEHEAYEAGFLTGYALAAPHLHAEIAALREQLQQVEHDADRYYAELCRRPAPRESDRVPYADLARRRGEYAAAARAGARSAAMAAAFATV